MKLPRALLRHTVAWEPLLGHDARGPLYGPAVLLAAYVEDGQRIARDRETRTTIANRTVWVQLNRTIGLEGRLTVDGAPAEVLDVAHYEGRLGTPDHTVIRCHT